MNESLDNLIQYSHLGLVMFVIMIAGWYGGTKFDAYFNTTPVGENVGFFMGLIGGFLFMFLEISRLRKQLDQDDENDDTE